jgi:hypothetical protein
MNETNWLVLRMTESLLALSLCVLSSCVKFAESGTNSPLLPGYRNRTVMVNPGSAAYWNLEEVLGYVFIAKNCVSTSASSFDCEHVYRQRQRIVASSATRIAPTRFDEVIIYQSRINKSVSSHGALLSFASNLEDDQFFEVIIRDVYTAKLSDRPNDHELAAVIAGPICSRLQPNDQIIYATGAILTRIEIKQYRKLDSSGNVTIVGLGFQAGDHIYASSSEFTKDSIISIDPLDITDLCRESRSMPSLTGAAALPKEPVTIPVAVPKEMTLRGPIRLVH